MEPLQQSFSPAAPLNSADPLAAALQNCEQAIAIKPDYPEAYNARGGVLLRLMRYDDAVASFDKAIELKPDYPQPYNSRGNALQALHRFEEAVESYETAIALKADYAAAYCNRGNAFRSLKRFEDAIESYEKAIILRPDYVDAYNNRGVALRRFGRFDEALQNFESAIALLPDHAGLHNNRGNALLALMRFEDAIESFDTAIALSPHYPDVYVKNRALVHLLMGRFEIGWRDYEARKNTRQPTENRSWGKPLWLGETDISGKTILVDREQGFGDVIQFCRYIRVLEDAGARVLFLPQKKLRALMRGLNADADIVDLDSEIPPFDLHCPLMSLPLAFKTDIGSIPSASYITADEEKVAVWRHRLGRKTKSRVGVVWRGNPIPEGRSIEFELFRRLFNPRFEFISLQKEVTDAERKGLDRAGVLYTGDALADFSDTAALCVLMDLVVSVDTSVAHLAGALGIPVWVLLTWVPDWRWLLDREDSPWYPSMRLFRQKAYGNWNGVLERIELELEATIPPCHSV